MSMELIAIISVGVTLAGLILNSQRNLRADMQAQRDETGSEFKTVRADMQAQLVETKTEFKAQREETKTEFKAQREETKTEFKAQREETKTEFKAQREVIFSLLERMAHLEGLLEGLREAITGRRVAEGAVKYDSR